MKAFILALLAGAAQSQPHTNERNFDFDGFTASAAVTFDDPALKGCVGTPEKGSCILVRQAIGDVRIYGGYVAIKRGRLSDIQFTGETKDFARAVETLTAKYGEPTTRDIADNGGGGAIRIIEWAFSDGLLSLSSNTADPRFYAALINRTNPDPKTPPKVDF